MAGSSAAPQWTRAEKILIDRIGHGLGRYQSPTQHWAARARVTLVPDLESDDSEFRDRQLISLGIIFDVSSVQPKAAKIEKFLSKRLREHRPLVDLLIDKFDMTPLPELALEIERNEGIAWEALKLALQGKLKSAVEAVPRATQYIGFEPVTPKALVDLIGHVAIYHLLEDLIRAGEDAYYRFFEPTGMDVLDFHGKQRAPTVKQVAKTIRWNGDWMIPLIALYQRSKARPLTSEEKENLEADPRLIADALRWQNALENEFGNATPQLVDELHHIAHKMARYIRRYTFIEERNAEPAKALHSVHGIQPLERLYLACAIAAEFLAEVAFDDSKQDKDDSHSTGTGVIYRMLQDMLNGMPVEPPVMPARTHRLARELFLLIRLGVTRDPNGRIGGHKSGADLIMAVQKLWKIQDAKHLGQEPFSNSVTAKAGKLYSICEDDAALMAEVRGNFGVRMQL